MPYLSFDLDALDAMPDVARAAGIDEAQVAFGLLRLWRHAWRAKSDVVTRTHLAGFFPGDSGQVIAALEAFEFIAAANNGTVRVRGADRYLRIQKARAAGGKKAAGNLKQNTRLTTGSAPADHRLPSGSRPAQAGSQPEVVTGSAPALTPSSDQRAANVTTSPTRASDLPLCDQLGAVFRELRGADYSPSPADEQAMSGLLRQANGSEAEIVRRYRIGLGRTRYPHVTTWVDLNKHWNACAAPETRQQAPPGKAGSKPPANVSSSDWDGVPTGEFPL